MRLLAWVLGLGGVIPFAGLAVTAWWGPLDWHSTVIHVLSVYAAVIVSFLGGVHWGAALNQSVAVRRHLLWGVSLSLLAWVAALLPWGIMRLSVFILLLLTALRVDRVWFGGISTSLNFGVLRTVLTALASLSLLLAIGSYARAGLI
ncbi:MAG: hypothetical protein B7X35_08420 [Halothiobacillus sp. 14-56-357]|jgi:dolichyl-phosphate-mannose--protein O-mannosyl transferase|uniref:DUF3429 domain-containing protein n=1 Tax=Halothiobacillus sp. 15-55-196 TaxID=1970382 RepID=UPI000BC58A3D|nr:DUF3429 domain-containing protein [Halothiobacillus sp. 15-55-196]OZB35858.1 MAG: hypothetical protein B7X44_08310 [Halothiobacillus sp. 15-55-196]OZB55783.1 MAG: hypothetical protein B7X35_08420 [Halothiobacillus sp. 14-56-357]OZB77568.1 MAG: hypothetical protein B7X29_08095 [Halothiobacillus sp. 13-55-115]